MIIDSHTHVGRNSSGYSSVDTGIEKTREDLLSSMQDAGIDKSVVFPLPVHAELLPGANMYAGYPPHSQLIPFAFIDPRTDFGIVTRICEYRGVKLHPLAHGYCVNHTVCRRAFDFAHALEWPVIIHSGWGEHGRMRYIELAAQEYTDVNIIVAHMVEPDCLDVVARNANMYIDTSYAPHPRRIEQAVSICGEDKVLFGSDYPYGNQRFELVKIELADLSSTVKDKILGDNIRRLI